MRFIPNCVIDEGKPLGGKSFWYVRLLLGEWGLKNILREKERGKN